MLKKVGGILAVVLGVALLGYVGYTALAMKQWPRRAIGATLGGIVMVGTGVKWMRGE